MPGSPNICRRLSPFPSRRLPTCDPSFFATVPVRGSCRYRGNPIRKTAAAARRRILVYCAAGYLRLDAFAFGGNLDWPHAVRLYDAGGMTLASATADSGVSLQGLFRYAALGAPLALFACTQYVLAPYYVSGQDCNTRDPLGLAFNGIAVGENRVIAGDAYPGMAEAGYSGFGWFGPNMLVSSAEKMVATLLPAALPMLALGLGSLLGWASETVGRVVSLRR